MSLLKNWKILTKCSSKQAVLEWIEEQKEMWRLILRCGKFSLDNIKVMSSLLCGYMMFILQ